MLQVSMTSPGEFIFEQVPIPEIAPHEVLVKIKRIGICGSDVHVYHGQHPYTAYPVIQGHEVSGEIVKIGTEVTGLAINDKVTIQPQVVCGICYPCTHGQYHICDNLKVMGFQTTGMAREYVAVAASKVLKLPTSLSFDEGAMIEPLAVAVHALNRSGNIKGKKVMVLGAGPIGNLVAQAAKGLGADKVMITDLSDFRLEVAKKCGVDCTVNSSKQDLQQAIYHEFGREKADLILECVGANATIDQAITYARKGTPIIVVGVFGQKAYVDLGLVQDRELMLIGTLMYQEKDWITAMTLVEGGKVKLKELITNHFDIKAYPDAYKYIDENGDRAMKVIITL